MSEIYPEVTEYINKLSNDEFEKILNKQGGDRDYIIFNIELLFGIDILSFGLILLRV